MVYVKYYKVQLVNSNKMYSDQRFKNSGRPDKIRGNIVVWCTFKTIFGTFGQNK